MGSAGAGMLRKLIKATAEHAIERKQFGKPIKDFDLIKQKIARLTIDAYVMESMSYMTAGMIDSEEYEDCAVEAALVKIYSSEACWNAASEAIQIFGGLGYMKDYPYERCLRDARILSIFEGTNEILRLFAALMGVQAAGKELRELVKKLRNPFAFPNLVLKKSIERWRHSKNEPRMKLGLKSFVHPSLEKSVSYLEYAIVRLQYTVELLLERHGVKITDRQIELARLANICIDIFGMASVLGRSSRAYCTGLQGAAEEIMIADAFCLEAVQRVRRLVQELEDGEHVTADYKLKRIADRVFEVKGYPVTHPLERNIW